MKLSEPNARRIKAGLGNFWSGVKKGLLNKVFRFMPPKHVAPQGPRTKAFGRGVRDGLNNFYSKK